LNNTPSAAKWANNGSTTSVRLVAGFLTPPAGLPMEAEAATVELIYLIKQDGINMNTNSSNRWLIAVAGIVMQIALGAVLCLECLSNSPYESHGWSVSQVTLSFELAILMLGFALLRGRFMDETRGAPAALPPSPACVTAWVWCSPDRPGGACGSFTLVTVSSAASVSVWVISFRWQP